ncbi:hypothetical protein [Petropleomorpha daqingensis]|uniref:Fibronectin type-III domain-containing protein n=1 Tax=Petropleomorpha daqingensis TaxID=2026353 RepID=A0A853C862_9ACTN|nr:hypothetical protein [Petropleomorpha daqingensis]NYJ04190.1 hypothetical protein [Petropleomorpha daqingensis]
MPVRPAVCTRRILAVAAGVAAAVSLAGPASAKEAAAGTVSFSTLPPAPTSGCAVKSFKHSSTTGVGDTGLSSVSADWSMRACDSKSSITVEVTVAEEFDPADVLYDDPAAPESGKVTVLGVQLETWYRITVTARDARTGATVGTATALEIAHRPTGA